MILREVKSEDDLYFQGPFWIFGKSLEDINNGNFTIVSERYLVDYDGTPVKLVRPQESTHEAIWNKKYMHAIGKPFDFYPRGRVVFRRGHVYLNIPKGINIDIIQPAVAEEFDYHRNFDNIFYKDPTTGGHYQFQLK